MKLVNVLILVSCFFLFRTATKAQCPGTATGQTSGTVFFNTTVPSGTNWTQPQNAQTNDNTFATVSMTLGLLANANTNYLTATGFGFSIPAGATICGVTVQVVRQRQDLLLGNVVDNSVKLVVGGSIAGTEHASASSWSTTKETVTYGGASDTWGNSLTPAIINNANFGVGVSANFTGGSILALLLTAGIDYVSISVNYSTTILPITVSDFSARRQNGSNVLNWTATSTTAGDKFVVQRSGDSHNWQGLETIQAAQSNQQYSYTDNAPLTGNNFYRLYLENQGGVATYSPIQEITENGPSAIRCYPNPVADVINISAPSPIHNVLLRDLQGRTILSRAPGAATNSLQLPVGGLPAGLYLLTVDGTLFKVNKQ